MKTLNEIKSEADEIWTMSDFLSWSKSELGNRVCKHHIKARGYYTFNIEGKKVFVQ